MRRSTIAAVAAEAGVGVLQNDPLQNQAAEVRHLGISLLTVNGNSTNKIRGVVYFPNQQVTYNGTGTGTAQCTQFVAKRLYWSGNSGLNNFTKNCEAFGMNAITAPLKVRLVA